MKIVVVKGIEVKIPKRYQENRKAWKIVSEIHNAGKEYYPKIKQRKPELTIPIRTDKKTIYHVRESRIFDEKWLKYFDSKEHLENYVNNYKNATKV